MIQDSQKNKIINLNIPFIGYYGYGSKILLKENKRKFIIKNGWSDKIFLVGGMFLFGPYITYLLLFSDETKDQPQFIIIILFLFSLIGWIFFIKFFYKYIIAEQKIIVDKLSGTISLCYGRNEAITLHIDDIDSYDIEKEDYSSKNNIYSNYILQIRLKNKDYINLFINNDKKIIEKLMHIIKFGSA